MAQTVYTYTRELSRMASTHLTPGPDWSEEEEAEAGDSAGARDVPVLAL